MTLEETSLTELCVWLSMLLKLAFSLSKVLQRALRSSTWFTNPLVSEVVLLSSVLSLAIWICSGVTVSGVVQPARRQTQPNKRKSLVIDIIFLNKKAPGFERPGIF